MTYNLQRKIKFTIAGYVKKYVLGENRRRKYYIKKQKLKSNKIPKYSAIFLIK